MHARTRRTMTSSRLAAIPILTIAAATGLATAGDRDLSWHTIDGGGGVSIHGDLHLLGTIGQPDAGGPATGADWSLTGGFLVGGSNTPPPPCPTDIDGSGAVDFGDLLVVLSSFGACPDCPADLDGNGDVDFGDLLAVLAAFGPCP